MTGSGLKGERSFTIKSYFSLLTLLTLVNAYPVLASLKIHLSLPIASKYLLNIPWPDHLFIGFYDWTDIEQDTDLTYESGKLYVIEITFSGRVVKRTNNNYYIDVEMYLYLDSYGHDDHWISYSNHLDGTWAFE